MIRKSLFFCVLFISFKAYQQSYFTKQFASELFNINRTLRVSLPQSYSQDSISSYPLAIVMNGEYLFDLYVGTATLYANNNKAPEQIVVGINMHDTYGEDIGFDANTGELFTSAKQFYQYIRDEVLFYMQENYRTSPFITLVADDYAANFASHFLGEPDVFINAFLLINPNFSDYIGNQLYRYNLSRLANAENVFYIYTNNNDALKLSQQESIKNVQNGLKALQFENLNIINGQINTRYTIGSIAAAIPNALANIFEIYAPITKDEYDLNIKDLSPDEAIEYLRDKYYNIDYLFGINMEIRESDIAAVEGIVIDKENGDKLKDFGKLFLDLRPKSPLGDYYLGLYYELGGDLKKALRNYRIGYSKMDPSDPKADAFYENILRVGGQ